MALRLSMAQIPAYARTPLFIATLTLVAPSIQAQMLEEVIVTAQKREQNLQDVPIAVSAFTGEMLQQSGVKDMFDLQTNTPGLVVGQSQNATTSNFAIRGIGTSAQNFGLESSVGLYVDGVYRARQGSMINNMIDIASVEVLRGPQGTLFGRNTPSGAIQMYSVKPDHEGTGFAEFNAGNYGLLGGSGAMSFSAIDNVLAFRATGFYTERDGTIDDVHAGSDVGNDRDRWGLRFQALYTPTDDLSVHVIIDHSEIDETCCVAGTFKNNLLAQDLPAGSAPKIGTDQTLIDLGGTLINEDDFYDRKVALTSLPVSTNEDQGISVQIDWDLDAFSLTSITAYREFDSHDNIDADFADIDVLIDDNNAEQSSFSQELRLSGDSDSFSYVVGLYYFEQDLRSESRLTVGEDTTTFVGAFGDAFPAGTGALDIGEQEHQSYAVFGQFDYNLTEDLVLTAGLRWTKEDKELVNSFTQDASDALDFSSPGWGFWLFPPLAPRDDVDESIDDTQVTGTVKLSWFMDDRTMFYASYGTGYKSGGTNTDRIDASLDVLFDAETSESVEVGMKADFPEQALRLNVALHKTDIDELQTIGFEGNGFALRNAGIAETYGAEVELYWQPLERTTLSLGYAHTIADFDDFEGGSCWIGYSWHTDQPDPGQNENGSCDRSGGRVAGNPEDFVVITANQDFDLGSSMTAYLYGEYSYTGDIMTDTNNDPYKAQGSYTLLNLRAGIFFENYDAEIVAWGRNVLDEEYLSTVYDSVLQDGKLGAYYRDPATYGITLRKNF